MATTDRQLDTRDLEARVKHMYREVAEEPHKEFHFETGRALAARLGYVPDDLDRIPAAAIDSFAGVGLYLDLAASDAALWAACIGGAMQRDRYFEAIEVAGIRAAQRPREPRLPLRLRAGRQRDPQVRRDERVPPRPKALALA